MDTIFHILVNLLSFEIGRNYEIFLHILIPLDETNPMIPHTPLKYNFSLSLVGSLDLGLFFSRVDRI